MLPSTFAGCDIPCRSGSDTWIGIDTFWLALPPEQLNLSHVRPEYYAWCSDAGPDGLDYFVIEPGPILDQAMYARHRAI